MNTDLMTVLHRRFVPKQICRLIMACLALFLLVPESSAFTSCPTLLSPPVYNLVGLTLLKSCAAVGHYEITQAALLQLPQGLTVSSVALARIAQGAIDVDLRETKWAAGIHAPLLFVTQSYQSDHHFDHRSGITDAQAFREGLAYVYQLEQIVIGLLRSGKCSNVAEALDVLSAALHAVQDAYSHSNYSDSLPIGIGSLGQSDFDMLVTSPPAYIASLPLSLNNLKMTLYDPTSVDPENPTGNCNATNPADFCHELWSKDFPGKSAEASTYFTAASNAAIAASSRFIQSIIGAVGQSNWSLVKNFGTSNACPQLPCSASFRVSVSNGTISTGSCTVSSYTVQSITSNDPNDKTGSQGVGSQQFLSGATPLRYAIFFGNEVTATAPAQTVTITDPLVAAVDDLATVSLGPIAFGNQLLTPPPSGNYSTTVDLRPQTNLLVGITATLNTSSSTVSWKFTSLDPATGLPTTDPTAGFLPPGGNGSVFFTVSSKQNLPTGTQAQNQATVVFDANPPINTPTWSNALDNTPPTSKVSALPSTEILSSFPVQWAGQDVGAGVRDFTVYVSDNGASFSAWLTNTTDTQGTYTGASGHSYGFYSIARDLVGNVENGKTFAEATTRVVIDTTPPVIVPQVSGTLGSNGWYRSSVTVSWSVSDPESGIASSTGCTPTTLTAETAGVTLTCSAINGAGLSSSVPITIKIDKTPPAISGMPATVCSLWPPNRKFVQVGDVKASDALSGLAPSSLKVIGTSNEPSDPSDPDIVITPDGSGGFTVQLRADRLGNGNGRVYTLNATAMDNAGNTATITSTCTVPHDQGN